MSRLFGQIAQIGYVVPDVHASMEHWLGNGVGPWFYVDRVDMDFFRYRGEDSSLEMSVAVANSGSLQIELIQQRNEAPSMYRDFLAAGHSGAQHVAYWSTSYQALYDRALANGFRLGQEGSIGGPQGRFAYFEHELDPGTVIEISDVSGPKGDLFAFVREAARDWDGTKPIHHIS
jgi:hypothetical protein